MKQSSQIERIAKELAFDWSIDYKPWEENLTPQEYARYGFEIGYLFALKNPPPNIEGDQKLS